MKFDWDDRRSYRNCDNCLDTEPTPAHIFDCAPILAALQEIRIIFSATNLYADNMEQNAIEEISDLQRSVQNEETREVTRITWKRNLADQEKKARVKCKNSMCLEQSYEPNSPHLQEVLIFYFNMKKSAGEAHRMLSNTYGEAAISERTCREWFQSFKNGDFEVEDQHGGGREKVFEDEELEALLDQDSYQTQQELSGSLGVTKQAILKRLKLLARQRRKGFLHRIVTGDEKWIRYDNPKRRKSWGYPGHASRSTAKPNIHGSNIILSIRWYQLGVVYYELLKLTETITDDRYRTQLMCLSRALKDKRPQYNERHDKVSLQHDNARPHVAKVVKTYLETLKWEVLPHPLYSPDLALSDHHLFRSMVYGLADQHFRSYEEVKNWIDSWIASKDNQFFQRGIRTLPERWENIVVSDGQYFES
ncbi:mariner Mos1 transposase [Trichonephila clavipes]|nr:mariner Mos1 transposase [Trichonephila clavipes]